MMEEPFPEGTVSICGCGHPLVPVLDEDGKRIGVNHPGAEENEHHENYFNPENFRVELPDE